MAGKQKRKVQRRQQKRDKSLQKLRESWKKGHSRKLKEPAMSTKSSVRAIRGGLPGNGR
jgi:hypothetical protein